MMLDPDAAYQVLAARDARFDGHLFVGVTSTGVYCRPICRVRTPLRRNCRFFETPAQAEAASFRPCLKCRPEIAPGAGMPWSVMDASRTLARQAAMELSMQAASQNQLAAYYMGIPVKQLNSLVWALAAMVAALAGLLLAPITFVHANMGFIGLKAFPAAVVGGFGSLPGAIVGGLIIGVVESLSGFYLPEGFKDVAAYVVVLLMLMIRPNGLFGETMRKKV